MTGDVREEMVKYVMLIVPHSLNSLSSIETIALNCLVFEKIAFFAFWRQTDRQTDRQMNKWTAPKHSAALAAASGGLINSVMDYHLYRGQKCGVYYNT